MPVLNIIFSKTYFYESLFAIGNIKIVLMLIVFFFFFRMKKWAYWVLVTFLNFSLAFTLYLTIMVSMAGHTTDGYIFYLAGTVIFIALLILTIVTLYRKSVRDFYNM